MFCSIAETDSPKPGQIDVSLIRVQRRHADLLKPDVNKRDGSQTITRSATVPNMNISPPLTAGVHTRSRQGTEISPPQPVSLSLPLI